jgi:hypothetical protein
MLKAFEALEEAGAKALARDITDLLGRFNTSGDETMVVPSKYLEKVQARPRPERISGQRHCASQCITANPRYWHLRDGPHFRMTVSGRVFSKPTFDDIIVRGPICLWPPERAYRATLVSSSAHSEEET